MERDGIVRHPFDKNRAGPPVDLRFNPNDFVPPGLHDLSPGSLHTIERIKPKPLEHRIYFIISLDNFHHE